MAKVGLSSPRWVREGQEELPPEGDGGLRSRERARGVPVSRERRGITVIHGHALWLPTWRLAGRTSAAGDLLSNLAHVRVMPVVAPLDAL